MTLGFETIDLDDLKRVARVNDIQDEEYVMKLAVAEFLRFDMNNSTMSPPSALSGRMLVVSRPNLTTMS